jgi:hypothetical protein
MPTIELHGFPPPRADEVTETIRRRLSDLPFRQDVVFVVTPPTTRVVGWDGLDRAFLRVLTRDPGRAQLISDRTAGLADIEVVLIEFIVQQIGNTSPTGRSPTEGRRGAL